MERLMWDFISFDLCFIVLCYIILYVIFSVVEEMSFKLFLFKVWDMENVFWVYVEVIIFCVCLDKLKY